MDVSPRQMVSVATSLIPFLEHDDANRALMGANMQRQAVPLLRSESPLVGTGMEGYAAIDAGDVITADKAGVVSEVSADVVTVQLDEGGTQDYYLRKFDRSNQGTIYNHRVDRRRGRPRRGRPGLADGPATENGELALGKNLLVAFMPWEGHNFEDAIILSQNLVKDDVLSARSTSRSTRSTPATPSSARRRSPVTSPTSARSCSPTSTSAASSASAPRFAPATSSSARSRRRARPSCRPRSACCARSSTRRAARCATPRSRFLTVKRARSSASRCSTPGRRRRARLGRQPARRGVHRPEAQDHRGRQARRPSRQQGRHRQDPAGRGHAVPRRRNPGRRHPQPARYPRPHELRPGARDPPRLGREAGLGGRGHARSGPAAFPRTRTRLPPARSSRPRCSTARSRRRSRVCSTRRSPTATASA